MRRREFITLIGCRERYHATIGRSVTDFRVPQQRKQWLLLLRVLAAVTGLGCVKMCASEERAELFSLLPPPDSGHQQC